MDAKALESALLALLQRNPHGDLHLHRIFNETRPVPSFTSYSLIWLHYFFLFFVQFFFSLGIHTADYSQSGFTPRNCMKLNSSQLLKVALFLIKT